MKDLLTNENLKGLFKSNFELANTAIRIAKYYVKCGQEVDIEHLLNELRKNPHLEETERLAAERDREEEETES
jgi:hypothetical protein